jgi:hypothetical protein
MAFARELTEKEKLFCASLGGVVVFWNHVESTFRLLLHFVARGPRGLAIAHRLDVLIANLGNVSLAEALKAIADDCEAELRDHLQHCAALFDALRIYRNYYVHGPITFHSTQDTTAAFVQQMTAKGGALKLHQGSVSTVQLDSFNDELSGLLMYTSHLISEVTQFEKRPPLALLEKPPLPDKLELRRLRLIELKRPPQS